MKVIWSNDAIEDFEQNIEYLYENWNKKVVDDFIIETEETIKIITSMPYAFKKHIEQNVHLATITKHITLIYQVKTNQVNLINFFNTFQEPK